MKNPHHPLGDGFVASHRDRSYPNLRLDSPVVDDSGDAVYMYVGDDVLEKLLLLMMTM